MFQKEILKGIDELWEKAEKDKRLSEFDTEMTSWREEAIEVDVTSNPQQAVYKLQSLYISKFEPLAAKITGEKPYYDRIHIILR